MNWTGRVWIGNWPALVEKGGRTGCQTALLDRYQLSCVRGVFCPFQELNISCSNVGTWILLCLNCVTKWCLEALVLLPHGRI